MISWSQTWARPWESPWGAIHTLAWYNQVSLRDTLAAIKGQGVSPEDVRDALDPRRGQWWAHAQGHGRTPEGRAVMAGLQQHIGAESATMRWCRAVAVTLQAQPRMCLSCMAHGYHSVLHQVAGLACCPLHGEPLSSACPACGGAFGDARRVAVAGFTCVQCDYAMVNETLPWLPGEEPQDRDACLTPIARWVEHGVQALEINDDWPHLQLYASTPSGPTGVPMGAALLPAMATIVTYPGDPAHFGPRIEQLTFDPTRRADGVGAALTVDDTLDALKAANASIFRALGAHRACYRRGARLFWRHGYDRDHVPWEGRFCTRAYAYLIWKRRLDRFALATSRGRAASRQRLYPSKRHLKTALASSFYYLLHGLAAQQSRAQRGQSSDGAEVLDHTVLPWVAEYSARWQAPDADAPSSALCLIFKPPTNLASFGCDSGGVTRWHDEQVLASLARRPRRARVRPK